MRKHLEVLHEDGGFIRGRRPSPYVQARVPRAQHLIKGYTARTNAKSRIFIGERYIPPYIVLICSFWRSSSSIWAEPEATVAIVPKDCVLAGKRTITERTIATITIPPKCHVLFPLTVLQSLFFIFSSHSFRRNSDWF